MKLPVFSYFNRLELEVNKNRLLVFLLFPIIPIAETCVLIHASFNSLQNFLFLVAFLPTIIISLVCLLSPQLTRLFKYIFLTAFMIFSYYEIWVFNTNKIGFQVLYVLLSISLLYLNARLTLLVGLSVIFLNGILFLLWKDIFFPLYSLEDLLSSSLLFMEVTLFLWGSTLIGTRFNYYVSSKHYLERLLSQIQQQYSVIQEQNESLVRYTKQIERLTLLEERNRIFRELQMSIGNSLTTIVTEIEAINQFEQKEPFQKKMNKLIEFSREYLGSVKQTFTEMERQEQELLSEGVQKLIDELQPGFAGKICLKVHGKESELPYSARLSLIRCLQELLSSSVRTGEPQRVSVDLYFQSDQLVIELEEERAEEAEPAWPEAPELASLRERLLELKGELQVAAEQGQAIGYRLYVPLRNLCSTSCITMINIVNQPLIAESVEVLLEWENDIEVVKTYVSVQEAMADPVVLEPQIILFDLTRPEDLACLTSLQEKWPGVKMVVLSPFYDLDLAIDAICANIQGYIFKTMLSANLANAVRIVNGGNTFFPAEVTGKIVEHYKHAPKEAEAVFTPLKQAGNSFGLTDKEIKILSLLAEGLRYKEVAEKLNFSESTIKNYVSIIYSKLEADNRMQAVKKAQEHFLI